MVSIPPIDGRTTISHTEIQYPADTAIISALNGIDPDKMLPFYTKASSRERMENLYPSSLYFIYSSFQRSSPTSIRNWSHLCFWGLEVRDKPARKFFSGFIYYQTAVTPLTLVNRNNRHFCRNLIFLNIRLFLMQRSGNPTTWTSKIDKQGLSISHFSVIIKKDGVTASYPISSPTLLNTHYFPHFLPHKHHGVQTTENDGKWQMAVIFKWKI